MTEVLKNKGLQCLAWAVNNPKKFFIGAMLFLSVSFVGSLIQGIFFPSKTNFNSKPPIMVSKSSLPETNGIQKDKEMEKIVDELKELKVKRDQSNLQRTDSLRIEYLYNEYQKLKNGY